MRRKFVSSKKVKELFFSKKWERKREREKERKRERERERVEENLVLIFSQQNQIKNLKYSFHCFVVDKQLPSDVKIFTRQKKSFYFISFSEFVFSDTKFGYPCPCLRCSGPFRVVVVFYTLRLTLCSTSRSR